MVTIYSVGSGQAQVGGAGGGRGARPGGVVTIYSGGAGQAHIK